ncbi:MAG: hypothetical protein IKG58_01540 [Bacilli bacterium]|nr:hypothetical protein [Bacilli bacterium]
MAKKKKKKPINRRIIEILIVISIIVILLGTYLLYLSNSKRIFLESINNLTSSFSNIEELESEFKNFTLVSNLSINTTGKIEDNKKYNNKYYEIITNLITNYNNTKANINYTSNRKNKELYIDYNSTVNKKDLITGKYLIKDNTEYYYINDITDTYINNGNNTYFETLNSDTKETNNLIYLKDTFNKYFIKNLDDKYFSKQENNNYTKITLVLDNKRLNETYKDTLDDLKEDKKAKEIIKGFDRDFFKKKVKDINFLKKDKKLYITIYTDRFTYSPNKYEIKYNKYKLIYKDNEFKLYRNNNIRFRGDISNKEKRLNINIYNKKDTKIGNFSLSRKKNKKKIVFYIKDRGLKNTVSINISKHKVNKKKYKKNINISLNGEKDNTGIYNILINFNNTIVKAKKIRVDVSESKLASSLPKENKKQIENKIKDIIDKVIK